MKKLNPRILWVGFFSLVNLICGIVIASTGSLLGETSGMPLMHANIVPWITILVIASYVIPLVIVFGMLNKIKVRAVSFSRYDLGTPIGIILLILQIGFIIFFVATGTFGAGSTNHSDSSLSAFWAVVSVDTLLLIYYGIYRNSRLFLPNLLVGIVSSLLRGWTGIFFIIIFMESCRLIRRGKLKFSHLAITAVVMSVCYPLLLLIKLQVRATFTTHTGSATFLELMSLGLANAGTSGFLEMIGSSFLELLARLHLVSNVIAVFQHAHQLSNGVSAGSIAPYWREGVVGLVYDRLTGIRIPDLGVALAQIIDPSAQNLNWNANPGYVGWLFVLPWSTPFYLLYTFCLAWISMLLVKKLKSDVTAMDMLWLAWCLYLIPGWIASFVLFTYSLLIFYFLTLVAGGFMRWKDLLCLRSAGSQAATRAIT